MSLIKFFQDAFDQGFGYYSSKRPFCSQENSVIVKELPQDWPIGVTKTNDDYKGWKDVGFCENGWYEEVIMKIIIPKGATIVRCELWPQCFRTNRYFVKSIRSRSGYRQRWARNFVYWGIVYNSHTAYEESSFNQDPLEMIRGGELTFRRTKEEILHN